MQDIAFLKQQFALSGELDFEQHASGMVMINIHNRHARAKISSYGGQLLSFQPHDCAEDLFFLSEKAVFKPGKAIRGGLPVCWPWFGDADSGLKRPAHGFARNQQWDVVATEQHAEGATSLTLQLQDSAASQNLWPYRFTLLLKVTVGRELTVSLITQNHSDRPFAISQALHGYFRISDVEQVRISGLDGCPYLDKLDRFRQKIQQGVITVDQALDRIYQQVPASIIMTDTGLGRQLEIVSRSAADLNTVIWNPWKTAAFRMCDLPNRAYRQFVCIETANALRHAVKIAAGGCHEMTATYRLSAL